MLVQCLKGFLLFCCCSFKYQTESPLTSPSPLARFSSQWNEAKYLNCNTAAEINYLSPKEKELIYILNLLRTDPKLFANTVVKQYPEYSGMGYLVNIEEYKSLLETLRKIKPLGLLSLDSLTYVSAQCHAYTSGIRDYTGHDRQEKTCKSKQRYEAECCDYGHNDPLRVIMSLLIDEHVPSLGHRLICLSSFKKIGVSIQPHKSYKFNAVLDFN